MAKRNEIMLPLRDWEGNYPRIVAAEIVDVAPHLADIMTFAVHEIAYAPGMWRISLVETGSAVGAADANSKADCIRLAKQFLAGKTRDEAMAALRRITRRDRALLTRYAHLRRNHG